MDNRSPLKELHMRNNNPIEVGENANKSINLLDMDTTFLQNSVLNPSQFDSDITRETVDSNQENLNPNNSLLTSFDPFLRKDEVKLCESLTDSEKYENKIEENVQNNERVDLETTFVISITEDLVKKAVNISLNETSDLSSLCNENNNSVQSELNNTVIILNSIKEQNFGNASESLQDNLSDSDLIKNEPNKTVFNVTNANKEFETVLTSTIDSDFIENFNKKLTFSQTLKEITTHSDINDEHLKEECIEIKDINDFEGKCEVNDVISLKSQEIIDKLIDTNRNTDEIKSNNISRNISDQNINEEELNSNVNKEYCVVNHNISVNLNDFFNNDTIVEESNQLSLEISSELSKDTDKETDEIETNKIEIVSENNINITVDKELNIDFNEENKDCEINKNVSNEINICSQINETLIDDTSRLINIYENDITVNNPEANITSEKVIAEDIPMSASETSTGVNEPSVAERLSSENSATCTNEMSKIINQNDCFEKETDVTNGAIDNKETLEAKVQVYREMAEKYAAVENECEKYKVQVTDLKKELKTCRQKTTALEAEVADLNRKENELNLVLAEYKQSTTNTSDTKERDDQLQRLQANEELLKNEIKELKSLVKQHETHLKELQRKEVKLADDLTCKTQSELQISRVMEEYEKSISSLMTENEKMKKERDTAQMHLANIEMAFSDVHQKYERCKAIVQGYKDNEESFKQDIALNRETIAIQEQKYETLKAHAMAQLEKSNQELAVMKKQHDTEMARLTAQLKRYEIKTVSLMESLEQKNKECEQLSAVCDEFIGNV